MFICLRGLPNGKIITQSNSLMFNNHSIHCFEQKTFNPAVTNNMFTFTPHYRNCLCIVDVTASSRSRVIITAWWYAYWSNNTNMILCQYGGGSSINFTVPFVILPNHIGMIVSATDSSENVHMTQFVLQKSSDISITFSRDGDVPTTVTAYYLMAS